MFAVVAIGADNYNCYRNTNDELWNVKPIGIRKYSNGRDIYEPTSYPDLELSIVSCTNIINSFSD